MTPMRHVRAFVHLHVHSTYSLGTGLISPAGICREAKRAGYTAVAITDVCGTFGFVEFHRAAVETGIAPIYGTYLEVDFGPDASGRAPLILIATDRTGLRNVCAAASAAAMRRERLQRCTLEDLSGMGAGVVAIAGRRKGQSGGELRDWLGKVRDVFNDQTFLEIRVDDAASEQCLRAARELELRPVLTQDVRFAGRDRDEELELLASVRHHGADMQVYGITRESDSEIHGMLGPEDISDYYAGSPEAYTNAALIASKVQGDLLAGMGVSDDTSALSLLGDVGEREHFDGVLDELFASRFGGAEPARREAMRSRLDRELVSIARERIWGTLEGFREVTHRLDQLGVALGPATALRLQSLTAWLLGVTRFNPYDIDSSFVPEFDGESDEMDILDLQISPDHRSLVLATLAQLFDEAGVGYVPSVEHITAARAMRFVGQHTEVDEETLDAALSRAAANSGATLKQLCEEDRPMAELYRRSAELRRLVARAASIEGLPMGFVRSRRTIIVSSRRLRDFLGATVNPTTNEQFVQATRDAFPAGTIRRIDIFALGAMAVCEDVARATNDRLEWLGGGPDARVGPIDEDEDLDGVYLLDTQLGRRLVVEFDVNSLDDIIVFIALMRYRLGPATFADRINAFRSHAARNIQPSFLTGIVAETRGWIIYDDQLRDIVAALTGLEAEEANRLVRRLADHDPANLAELRRRFMKAAVEASTALDVATGWYPRILRYAGRTVSRQRVIADASLVRTMIQLRRSSPAEYYAALADRASDAKKREVYLQKSENFPSSNAPGVVPYEREPARSGAGARKRTRGNHPRSAAPVAKKPATPAGSQLGFDLTAPTHGSALERKSDGDTDGASIDKQRNKRGAFHVISSLAEFYPHPTASRVELAGRVRDLQSFKSSSGEKVSFFVLFDSRAFVRVFIPSERVGDEVADGESVLVRGIVRVRAGKKVCEALEVKAVEGGNSDGETTPDEPPT